MGIICRNNKTWYHLLNKLGYGPPGPKGIFGPSKPTKKVLKYFTKYFLNVRLKNKSR